MGHRGRGSMVIGFTTTCLIPAYGDVYSIQHYVIKRVSDLRQVGDMGSSTTILQKDIIIIHYFCLLQNTYTRHNKTRIQRP
jgi:hypothetical protein